MNHYFLLNAVAICDVGKVREKNQDNLFFDKKLLKEHHLSMNTPVTVEGRDTMIPQVFGVFDGMGGHLKGETASFITALETARNVLDQSWETSGVQGFYERICQDANQKVCMEISKVKARVGTTAAMLFFWNQEVWVCNIGDSPIYRIGQDHKLTPIFEEHTERLMRESIFGKDERRKKYPLTQHIGIFPDELEISPYIRQESIQVGDRFLICSDGLTDMVDEETIADIACQDLSLEDKIMKLRDHALSAGGRDNITIIYVEVCDNSKSPRVN